MKGLTELAKGMGLPLVASNDVHYLTPDDKDAHDILLCIQTGSLVADKDRMRMEGEWYLKSPEEMAPGLRRPARRAGKHRGHRRAL